MFVEDDGQRHRLRAELHGRRAERIRGLQRMAALHAAVALPALPHRDAKLVHEGALDREIFLILRHDASPADRPATVGAVHGERRLMDHVDVQRAAPMRVAAIGRARLAAGPLGISLRQAARKRRRLPVRATARHLQFFAQPFVLTAQPRAFVFRAAQVVAESFNLPTQVVDILGRVARRIRWSPRHAIVMADSREKYKDKFWDLSSETR